MTIQQFKKELLEIINKDWKDTNDLLIRLVPYVLLVERIEKRSSLT